MKSEDRNPRSEGNPKSEIRDPRMRMMGVMTLALPVLLAGCLQYRPAMYPLQPGDAIVFGETNRANEFRRKSGNDSYELGVKVLITRPTLVQCE